MCSLLGHDYGDPGVERERSEEGTEVVLTAKRVERCRNCGHERTLSENTEVTALSAAAGVVREPDGTVVAASGAHTADADGDGRTERSHLDGERSKAPEDEPTETRASESAPLRTDGRRDRDDADGRSATLAMSVGNDSESDDPIEVVGDDEGDSPGVSGGSIADSLTAGSALDRPTDGTAGSANEPRSTNEIEESEDTTGSAIDRVNDAPTTDDRPHRAPGEWPDEPTGESVSEKDGSTGSSGSGGVSSPTGRWPNETDHTPQPIRDGGANGTAAGNESRRETGVETTAIEPSRTVGSFACGSCGFGAAVADSPLRAGDICPDCGGGYLALETRKG